MTEPTIPPALPTPETDAARFRRTLMRVMTVQVVSLALLWWLQTTFSP